MKALVYDGKETLNYRDMPAPTEAPGEEIVRVDAVGICGSDMHAYHGTDPRRPAPLILGHEAAGHIVGGARDGERVTVNPLVTCGTCSFCMARRPNICQSRELLSMPPRQGAFAEYLRAPSDNLVTVPDDVPLAKAALAEPLAVAWHAARLGMDALRNGNTRNALVLGGGAIGVAAALCLRAQGIEDVTIIELNQMRRRFLAEKMDCKVTDKADGQYGVVVDAVGYDATRAASTEAAEAGGVILHIGLGAGTAGLDIRRMTLQEITFIGTYCYTPDDFRDTAHAIYDGRLGALNWTEDRKLADGAQAFADLDNASVAAPKIVLMPQG
ncbi:MAG: alcohol dehydrogenase catalytic domain-containing protein [Pseudomonadota bacterium]